MDIETISDILKGKRGKGCVITTTTGVFEGVYRGLTCPKNSVLMEIMPTGKTKERFAHITYCGDDGTREKSDEFGIVIDSITSIEFPDKIDS